MSYRLLPLLFLLLPVSAIAQEVAAPPQAAETPNRLKTIEERLEALEGAPAKTSISAFNPAMGMALDMAYLKTGSQSGFQFRAAELGVEAPIDPFLKGWAVITGSNGSPTVDVEEATLETTALPYNLTVRGGRLFADFGRLAHFHDHELPVIERPRSLDTFIGGETRADGLEIAYLFPMDTYLTATFGAYDKMGAENDRQDPSGTRKASEYTYMGRLHTYKDIGDSHSVDVGVSEAWTPKRFVTDTSIPGDADGDGFPGDGPNTSAGIITSGNTWRTLTGVDITYRYNPVKGGLYHGIVWGTEVYENDERRFDPDTNLPTKRVNAYAGYSYIQLKMGTHWRPTAMMDITEDLDNIHKVTKTYTAALSYDVTEFQRLRLAYSHASTSNDNLGPNDTIGIQWSGVLGHHVHGFRDR